VIILPNDYRSSIGLGWRLLACLVTAAVCGGVEAAPTVADPVDAAFFETHVRPVLVERCGSCHGAEKQKAGLRLDGLVGMLRGGESGPAIEPGDPAASNLVAAIRHESWEMPPDGRLPDDQIVAIERWIAAGAPWPGSKPAAELIAAGLPAAEEAMTADSGPRQRKQKGTITDADRSYWAYQPVQRPDVPSQPAGEGLPDGLLRSAVHNPIDRFILARLATARIEPVAEADRATLARRLYLDLLGVPPQPADVASFVADPASDAYERLVDRLLADPRYGERFARHWLDLARYAESDGFRQDAFRPTAWRYRDYVIAAFNADKPFDRFILEQLAGDELFPHDVAAITATGFLRQTPYEYNQVDVERQRSEILNEVTDATADVFLAMGMGCARCHDHKFDPLLQRDYFSLQSFFAPLVWRDVDESPSSGDQSAAQRAYAERADAWRSQLRAIEQATTDEAAWKGLERFPPEIKQLFFKPSAERSSHEEQLVRLAGRQVKFHAEALPAETRARYGSLKKELADFEASHAADKPPAAPAMLSVADVSVVAPRTTIPGKPAAEPIEPRVPTVLGGGPLPPADLPAAEDGPRSTGRRAALARWIASPDNPLTARVFVNRLWQWHFGRGLVPTTSDFGNLGEDPSHPDLLDWLAAEFVASGWSVKHVNRLIVTTAAYRRSVHPPSVGGPATHAGQTSDPHNHLLWRQNCRRLDAEQVRDAALTIAGELDPRMAGPSVPPTKPRRSIYTTCLRNTRDDLCDVFDAPDGYASCAERNCTTTPMQALFLVNGEWMLARSRALALQLEQSGIADDDAIVAEAIRRATGREPSHSRVAEASAFLRDQRRRLDDDSSTLSQVAAQRMPQRAGLAAVIDPASPSAVLTTPAEGLPTADFTIEAHVVLQSLFADATVRTIASQWTGATSDPGWSLGVTSEKSKYKPRNLVLQLAGDANKKGSPYEVIPSGIHLELQRPYFVAASVRVAEAGDRSVTFFCKDLSDNDSPLVVKQVKTDFAGSHASPRSFAIGGRDATAAGTAAASVWDGLIDDVRLSNRALAQRDLLWEDGDPVDAVVGFWTFEETPGFAADASGHGRSLVRDGLPLPNVKDIRRYEALVDLCHVLFNSSEFLYVE
jgi:hypothetical protein